MSHHCDSRHAVPKFSACSLAVSLALTLGTTGTAYAQASATPPKAGSDNSDQIEEILVSANKRGDQALQSVGSSIGVITAAELEKRGVTEFMDIARNVPGVNVVEGGPGQKTILIRGIVGAGESTVGLYYDGMATSGSGESAAISNGRQTDFYVYDADRVEVMRGPQSTLYGSSALAGVVRVITKQADASRVAADLVINGASTASGADSYALKAMVNVPVVENVFAVRLAAYKAHDGGFINNVFLNRTDVNSTDQSGMRLNAKWNASPRSSLSAQLFVQNMDSADQAVQRIYNNAVAGVAYPSVGELNNDNHTRQPRTDRTTLAGLTYEHSFDNLNLTLSHSIFDRKNKDAQDLQGLSDFFGFLETIGEFPKVPLIPNGSFVSTQETKMNTTEARVATKYSGSLNGVVGLMHQNRKIDLDNRFVENDPKTGLPIVSIPVWYNRVADFSLKQTALYGEATYDVTSKLAVIAGARAFKNSRTDNGHGVVGFMRISGQSAVSTQSASESKVIYKGQVNYKVDDSMMIYSSASQGYRAGGTVNQVVPELPPKFGADYTWNYEVGAKTEWLNRRLQLNVSAYHIDWYDMQVNGSYFNGAFDGVLNCSGKCAHSNGIEVELTARPARGLDLSLATTYFKAQLDKDQPSIGGAPKAGTQLRKTPTFSFAASANYNWGISGDLTGNIHADLQHMGKVANMSYDQAFNYPAPAYTLLNGSISVASGDRWEAKLYSRNMTNKNAQVNTEAGNGQPAWVYVNRPRTVGIELNFRY